MDIDLKQLREIMKAMKQLGVNELEIENGDDRMYLRRGPTNDGPATVLAPTMIAGPASIPPAPMPSVPPPAPEPAADDASVTYITSPFVGTFYRSPNPDSAPFVEVGSKITSGSILCIVEAMKLMNEIEAELAGEILEVLVDNGKPVEYGDRLFKLKKA